jgi:hypothetical protein
VVVVVVVFVAVVVMAVTVFSVNTTGFWSNRGLA